MDLSRIAASLSEGRGDAPLPVEQWHPEHCGEMDLVIRADGSWWHEGGPITRPALVRLFSRVLRRDDDGYVLVTPAEKVAIEVEDAPFLAVDFDREAEGLVFRTNVGDVVRLSAEHPMALKHSEALGQDAVYLHVRGGLEARLDRPAYYRLVDMMTVEGERLVIESFGETFTLPIRSAA